MSTKSSNLARSASMSAGVLGIAGGALLLAGTAVSVVFMDGLYVMSLHILTTLASLTEILLAIIGGVLCLRGLVRFGPWLLVGALLVGEVYGRFIAGQMDGYISLPWDSFINFSDGLEILGAWATIAWLLFDLAFWIVLAAAVLGVIAFFTSMSSPDTQSVSYSGGSTVASPDGSVPAGWYPDPEGKPSQRYWDGTNWTDQSRPSLSSPALPATSMANGVAAQNGMGTAALVLGILGFFCFPLIASVLAIIFGRIGMTRADRGLANNRGAAKAGFILGIIGVSLAVIGLIIWIAVLASTPSYY